MINRLLIANRGEIALRVIRAAKSLGIETLAIYAQQDAESYHIRAADQAICLGNGNLSDTYMNIEKIISIAKENNVDAIHPGYGFLAENANFAAAVLKEKIIWVGPPVNAIKILGDKLAARAAAEAAGVPTTPGSPEPVVADAKAIAFAKKIGFPVIVKASHGGGGMGIAVVEKEEELLSSIEKTSQQALSVFGNGEVFIEKYITNPRHIEFQFIADGHGNVVHLGERECSIQRRHQKLIEEAPSVVILNEQRDQIGEAVKRLALAVNYENAGTAEFLYENGKFYFNEVNTRIQVEHPVTEIITGKDLVVEQLLIAAGAKLSWEQQDIKFQGHAIEFRINAEDPLTDFTPVIGTIEDIVQPGGPGIRFDTHIYSGYSVPREYDSLLGKLIVWGETREQAIKRAFMAVSELSIIGIPTNSTFHRVVLANKEFHKGNVTTQFIEQNKILPYIKLAFYRRLAAIFATKYYTQKVFLPPRIESKWHQESIRESVGRW